MPLVESEVVDEDPVEEPWVVVLVEEREAEEGKGRGVGGRELAEEVLAPGEECFEELERCGQLDPQLLDSREIRARAGELGLDLVRRPLPDTVEPVDEEARLGPSSRVARVERRVGEALLEMLEDARGVGDDRVAVHEHRDELLAADLPNGGAVVGIHRHGLDLEPLVREREGDALDVRRKLEAIEPQHVCDNARPAGFLPRG